MYLTSWFKFFNNVPKIIIIHTSRYGDYAFDRYVTNVHVHVAGFKF
jgi:hypothetical protein